MVGLILKEKERKMKKLILVGLFLGTVFLNANEQTGKELYAKCAGCHGQDGKMKALGKATPLQGQASASLFKKMLAYKEGTRNVNGMSGFMKGQVSSFSRLEMLKISNYISDPSVAEKEITECFEDSDRLWKKLEQKYKQEILEHSGGDETSKYIEKKACFKVDNERMMVALYAKNKQEYKHSASFLLAKIDRENKIVESRFFKDVFMFNYLTTTLTIDSKSYITYSLSKPFGIVVEEELDGPPTLSKKKLFIYELDGLKPILSNLTIEEYDEEMAGHNLARVASLKTTKINSDYAPLIFSHNYSYAFDGIKEKWKVKLDDIECLYKNGKYECKVNPVFELKQVEENVKKGLKYRKIVLQALLDEVPLSKENLETYNSIVFYLKRYKHEKEARFLEDQILYKIPKEKSLAQVENLEEKYLLQKKVQKIKKSNKSYQIYQKLNKYDILMMLIKESNFFDSSKYRTYNLKYAGYMDAFMESKNTIRLLIHVKRDLTEDEKKIPFYKTIRSINYQLLTNNFHEYIHENGKSEILPLKYPKIWLKIFNIYHLNKKREYLFIKEKSYLYKKPNSKSKSKKFLIKNDCALILDKTSDGWYKVFYYHPHWHTNTIMWIKFDVDKHGLIG